MDFINTIFNSAELSELLSVYLEEYQQSLLFVLLAIALLNCFFGYHLRKLWGILAGMMLGALISAAVCITMEKTGMLLYIVMILGSFILGLLALLLYRVGLFFICVWTIPFLLNRLFTARTMEVLILWIALGIAVGIMTILWERQIISVITSLGGGFTASMTLLRLSENSSVAMLLMIGSALSIAGLFIQFQPWRSRSSWNSDEERARDKHRHKRRMRRIRRKKRHQALQEQKKKGGSAGKRWPSASRTTSEYTPYTTRTIYREQQQEKSSGRLSYPDTGKITPIYDDTTEQQTSVLQENQTTDLSDIRQAISKEVSDIYQEQQQEMDHALNQLLEQEYQNTTRSLDSRSTRPT